jgi:enoyl-CoA hydratase/carnithine racemase
MELKAVRYEVDDAVATITLDRPHRLNAWTGLLHTEHRWAVAEAEADQLLDVMVEEPDFIGGVRVLVEERSPEFR